jgi:hypothetical protein
MVFKDINVADTRKGCHNGDEEKVRFLKYFKSNIVISTRVNPSRKARKFQTCRILESGN